MQNPLKTKHPGAEKLRESADGSLQHSSTIRLPLRPLHVSCSGGWNSRLQSSDLLHSEVQREAVFTTTRRYPDTRQDAHFKRTCQKRRAYALALDLNHRASHSWKLWRHRQYPHAAPACMPGLRNRGYCTSVLLPIHLRQRNQTISNS